MTEVSSGARGSYSARAELLARRLRRRADETPSIPRRSPGAPAPLSHAQERLWFMDQYSPGNVAFTIVAAFRLHGTVDPATLHSALGDVVDRHEALRMRFPATSDGAPTVVVDDALTIDLPVAPAASDEEARALIGGLAETAFDLATGPLLRAVLIELAPDEYVLGLCVHHIAFDGWSVDVFMTDLLARYESRLADTAPAPLPPVLGYGDYAAWQREQGCPPDDLAYWRAKLADLPPLDLPTDHRRPPEQTFAGATRTMLLDQQLVSELSLLARGSGATLYMALLAAFTSVLGRWAHQDDFAVGSPVAGRDHREVERIVGCFINMLTMRADVSGDPTFTQLLGRTRDTAVEAYEHQGVPFELVVQELDVARDISRTPLFQVLFSMQNYGDTATVGDSGVVAEQFPLHGFAPKFDIELYAREYEDGVAALFVYNSDLFSPGMIERLASHLSALLRAAVAAPDTPLSQLDVLPPAEHELVVETFNDTAGDFPADSTLHDLVAAQTQRTPDAVALRFEGASMTYAELDVRSNRLANHLFALGVRSGEYVAVCLERSFDLVVALLAVLKAGGAYVPLDPEYPAERLDLMVSDAAVRVLLTHSDLSDRVPDRAGTLVVPLDSATPWSASTTAPAVPLAAADAAYLIYTSGSTGRPKGVPNSHRGIVNRLDWMQKAYPIGPADAVLQKTPASFDVSVWELFWPMITGARLVLARPGGHKDTSYLCDVIRSEHVTTTHFVPSMLSMFLVDDAAPTCTSLRRVICSGEELPADLARRALELLPAELHNLYGPTEAAVDVSYWHCTPEGLADLARVPIGRPIQNMRLYVLDERRRPLPIGVPGELYIGGVGVALGYHARPELTAEKFLPDPFGVPDDRLYRTGDLAKWRPDGTVDFLGRIDNQVKVRGLRIELGEIEVALRAQPGVREAAVVVREDKPGDKRIVAYVVGAVDAAATRAALKQSLPDYMVPTAFVEIDSLPLSPNGKLVRAALPAPQRDGGNAASFVAPSTETEIAVAEIWGDVLDVERIGADDDFFDLGGHSLLATQVVARLRKQAGAGVSVMDVFKHRTVRELAALIAVPAEARGPRALLHELTKPVAPADRVLSYVCVPYGGGSAVVYQPLADALPSGYRLFSVAIPGHDVGLDEASLPFDELAQRCVDEILATVEGPVALYGHCGVGSALTVEIARRLEAAGRELDAVYIGAIFPFARPGGRVANRVSRALRMEGLRADRAYTNWLTSMGVDMSDIDDEQARQIIRNMRKDSESAEEYFTSLLQANTTRLRAPIVTVAGERDPATDYFQERFREWHFLTGRTAVVVLDEAGHFFLKYRAAELADIVTRTHTVLDEPETLSHDTRGSDATWWLHDVSRSASRVVPVGPQPSMKRFLLIASGQLVSMTGAALTEFAIPLWMYMTTGSVLTLGLLVTIGLVPGMLVSPLAGAIVDRYDRRRVMIAGDVACALTQAAFAALIWSGTLAMWHVYVLLSLLSVGLTFQRLAYFSAIPQLVPKQFLGHANGIVQMVFGVTRVIVPLVAVGLIAAIGIEGILVIDLVSYAFAIGVVLLVRFPATMAWRRRESLSREVLEGLTYSWRQRPFRAMLLFFAVLNLFLAPPFLLISPLVLEVGTLTQVGHIAVASGLGAFIGGVAMTAWGGPRRRRMLGMMWCTVGFSVASVVTGLQPSLVVVAVGAFGMSLWLTLLNGIYTTIVQVKVPQRFHGRVFALNTVLAWSTLPIAWIVIAPMAQQLLDPLLLEDGPLAGTVGIVFGVGPGRGIGFSYLLFALAMVALVVVSMRRPIIGGFDDDVPDAVPDDLVGLEALQRHGVLAAGPADDDDRLVVPEQRPEKAAKAAAS